MGDGGAETGTAWLSLVEIAKRLERSESTVYYWQRTYRDEIPEQRDAAGHRLFPLQRFEEISALLERGRSVRQVKAALASGERPAAGPDGLTPFQTALLAEADRIASALERIADRLEAGQTEEQEPESRA